MRTIGSAMAHEGCPEGRDRVGGCSTFPEEVPRLPAFEAAGASIHRITCTFHMAESQAPKTPFPEFGGPDPREH